MVAWVGMDKPVFMRVHIIFFFDIKIKDNKISFMHNKNNLVLIYSNLFLFNTLQDFFSISLKSVKNDNQQQSFKIYEFFQIR